MPNTSDANSTNSTNAIQTFSEAFRAGPAVFTIILAVGTIFGNVLVIAAFSRYARMRTVTNYFLVSLACTDLCVALFSMPVWVAYLLTGPEWVLGTTLNRVWTMIDILMGIASIINLMAISFDRVLYIWEPLRYSSWMTPWKVTSIIIFIWIYSLGMAIASFLLYAKPIFNLILMIMCFCVPLLVIITTYTIIFRVALRHLEQIHATAPVQNSRSPYSFMKEFKVAKTLAVVMGAFVICWAPFVSVNMIYSLCPYDLSQACPVFPPEVILVTKWMHYGNSLLNPIIYTGLNLDFRRAIKALLTNTRAFTEEGFQTHYECQTQQNPARSFQVE